MRRGQWTIHTREPGKPDQPYLFYAVAASESEALRLFRKGHKRWRILKVEPPQFPAPSPKKPKARKK